VDHASETAAPARAARDASPAPSGSAPAARRSPDGPRAAERNLALIGYVGANFDPFAARLEREGFRVFRVHSLASATQRLRRLGVPAERILEIADPATFPPLTEDARLRLAELEGDGLPRIHSIILMDRLLRRMPHDFALRYLAAVQEQVTRFLLDNRITCVSSGRDTALQLLTMLICKQQGIGWGCVTYTKLPVERFALSPSHVPTRFYPIREVTEADVAEARTFLEAFHAKQLAPIIERSAGSWMQVLRWLPRHLRLGLAALADGLGADRGNRFARRPLSDLLRMYAAKKRNLFYVNHVLRYPPRGNRPFALIGLHRQPESSVDVVGAYYSDQVGLIGQIARSLPLTHDLYVKVHHSDIDGQPPSFYRELQGIPGVKLVEPLAPIRRLVAEADLIVTNTGATGYEAGLMGKPVIAFADVFWTGLPTVHYCDAPPRLPELIGRLLAAPPPADLEERVVRFLAGVIAHSFPCLPNRVWLGEPFSERDLDELAKAYDQFFTVCRDGGDGPIVP